MSTIVLYGCDTDILDKVGYQEALHRFTGYSQAEELGVGRQKSFTIGPSGFLLLLWPRNQR